MCYDGIIRMVVHPSARFCSIFDSEDLYAFAYTVSVDGEVP